MTSIFDECDRVATREDLARFIRLLVTELQEGRIENDTLDLFLEALSGWTADMHGYFLGIGAEVPDQPSWNLIANMLIAATAYD